jgi:hypothetical protein
MLPPDRSRSLSSCILLPSPASFMIIYSNHGHSMGMGLSER